jgi:hypothetical protein
MKCVLVLSETVKPDECCVGRTHAPFSRFPNRVAEYVLSYCRSWESQKSWRPTRPTLFSLSSRALCRPPSQLLSWIPCSNFLAPSSVSSFGSSVRKLNHNRSTRLLACQCLLPRLKWRPKQAFFLPSSTGFDFSDEHCQQADGMGQCGVWHFCSEYRYLPILKDSSVLPKSCDGNVCVLYSLRFRKYSGFRKYILCIARLTHIPASACHESKGSAAQPTVFIPR